VLTPEDIDRVKLTFVSLPGPVRTEERTAMDQYVSGLTFLAASDVHMPMETQAFGHFLQSLMLMMRDNKQYKAGEPFEPAFKLLLEKKDQLQFPELQPILGIIRAYDSSVAERKPINGPPLKIGYVAVLKAIVDWYFLTDVRPQALKKLAEEASEVERR
jgi:hypothetical protein